VKLVRGRADARFMPSRFHFAIFRLGAFVRLRSAKPQPQRGLLLAVDRHQTAREHYLAALWYVGSAACFASELLSIPIALAAVVVLASFQLLLCVIGLARRNQNNIRAQSIFMMALLAGGAAYYAFAKTWIRFAAWQVLAVMALNALCALILFFLRGSIARAEASLSAA
jgi:hypothetical protein